MDEYLIKIYESEGTERIWLQDKLEDEDIPYKVILEEYWTGAKYFEYHIKQCVFIDVKDELLVKGFIDEYNNVDFNLNEEFKISVDFENIVPQITCPACGEKIDFDYPKCPFCKHEQDR